MRILHVGHGFRPWRPGGLVTYIEGLLDAQVARGHDVAYFVSGRHYPRARPRLRRYRRRGVATYELQSSPPLFGEDAGTRDPGRDLDEPFVESCFRRALADFRPDIVSVLDLAGLPSSLLDLAPRPVVMTVHDYLPLCPTVKLFDADGRNCVRDRVGEQCARCCAHAPAGSGPLVEKTLEYELMRVARHVPGGVRAALAVGGLRRRSNHLPDGAVAAPDAYQRRRDVNVERLNRLDLLVTCSRRVAEIYEAHGVDPARIRVVHGTVPHLERLAPRRLDPAGPLHFATLNGLASTQKGADLMIEALRLLGGQTPRLSAFGYVHPRVRDEAAALGVELRGPYATGELDGVLADVDVGVLPSVYEEPYAYSGLEFLAKAIPLVANAVGGSPEYVRDGETGWLNRSNDAQGLAAILAGATPPEAAELNRRLLAAPVAKPIAAHAEELEAIYAEAARATAAGR